MPYVRYQYWIQILDFFQIKVYSSILWVWNTEWIPCIGCTFCAHSLYWKKLAFLAMSDYPVETNFFLITSYFLIWICKNCNIVCQNCNFHISFFPSDLLQSTHICVLKWRKVVEWWELLGHFFCKKKILKVSFIRNLKRTL